MTLRTTLTRAKIEAAELEVQEEIEAEHGTEDQRMDEFMAMSDAEQEALVAAESEKYAREYRERMSRMTPAQYRRYVTYSALERCLRTRMRNARLAQLRAPAFVLEDGVRCLKRNQRFLLQVRAWRAGGPEPSHAEH